MRRAEPEPQRMHVDVHTSQSIWQVRAAGDGTDNGLTLEEHDEVRGGVERKNP